MLRASRANNSVARGLISVRLRGGGNPLGASRIAPKDRKLRPGQLGLIAAFPVARARFSGNRAEAAPDEDVGWVLRWRGEGVRFREELTLVGFFKCYFSELEERENSGMNKFWVGMCM